MDIKDQWQVCSLELSKRLKELGYPQESLWYWVKHFECRTDRFQWDLFLRDDDDDVNECISAPTSGELGMALPEEINSDGEIYKRKWDEYDYVYIDQYDNEWFYLNGRNIKNNEPEDITEANARGLMWEYLKKNGLIKEKGR